MFSHFQTPFGLREKVSRNRINGQKCIEMGKTDNIHFLPHLDTFVCGKSDASKTKIQSKLSAEGAERGVRS